MPHGITIIGLGPGDSRHWTQAAATLLSQADEVYLRTTHHPGLADISAPTHNFDNLFTEDSNCDHACNQIAAKIVQLGQRGDQGVIYAVPGNPSTDEPTVPHIRALANSQQLPVTIFPGLSILDTVRATLNLDGAPHLQIVEARDVAQLHHPPLAPDHPALIMRVYSSGLAAKIKQYAGKD